jgi:RNA polymerase sigma-B factor
VTALAWHPGRDWDAVARDDCRRFARARASRDPRVRHALVERHLPLARHIAARFAGGSEPFDDLLQVARLALVRAVDRFDPDRGLAFSSFAVPTILGELKRHYRDTAWSVRVPRPLQELAIEAERTGERLTTRLGRAPSTPELAAALGVPQERVLEALVAINAYRASSLDAARDDEDEDRGIAEVLGYQDAGFEHVERRAVLEGLLRRLTRREREVLRLRFEEDLLQSEIGAIIGVSQMQVSRILRHAVSTLVDAAEAA